MGDGGKQVVRRFYEELWNGGNLAAADELVAEDYIRHDLRPGDAPPGPAGQKAVAQRFRAAFPDVRLEVEALVGEGDVVVARWTMTGTHSGAWGDIAPTERQIRFSGVNFFRIVDGKIAEIRNLRDDLGLESSSASQSTPGIGTSPRAEASRGARTRSQPHARERRILHDETPHHRPKETREHIH